MKLCHGLRAALLLAAIALTGATPAVSATSIEVIVNDKAITSYDVDQRAKLLRLTTRRSAAAAQKAALEELVDETLKLQEAERLRISVSKGQVDEAFGNIAQNVKLTPSRLEAALKQSGVNPGTLRDRLKAELAWSQAVRNRFRATVKITDSDVIAALRKDGGTENAKSVEYTLQSYVFVVPSKASNDFKAKRKREVDQFRAQFTSCEEGEKTAKGLNEVVAQPARRRLEAELPGNLKDAVQKVSVGRTTEPTLGAKGFEFFAVCDKREIDGDVDARVAKEAELRNKEGEALSRQYLRELRQRALIDYR
ncbi:SurA N-terminal domain-containing protein [Stappia sp. F7233]|uniref:SurA N-terminal domain-containing protein n=1 Tax=Stappia albiluteola TaxID=2758565 RepID=A0A839ACE9_9HYPH|nr:SurA N-terminal domain-containing protein [Stappia albiluteola]MBA5776708.1 SurA N-terminal domain-containing protein [Stappia albiluteola]